MGLTVHYIPSLHPIPMCCKFCPQYKNFGIFRASVSTCLVLNTSTQYSFVVPVWTHDTALTRVCDTSSQLRVYTNMWSFWLPIRAHLFYMLWRGRRVDKETYNSVKAQNTFTSEDNSILISIVVVCYFWIQCFKIPSVIRSLHYFCALVL